MGGNMEQLQRFQLGEPRTILIVDDDRDTCMMLDTIFRVKGYTTRVVYTGREAVQLVEVREPDAVVLDVMMPEMDGWETYRQLREFSNIPVLFLTALSSGKDAARALNIGVFDYIRKPFDPEELIARVDVLFTNPTYSVISERVEVMRLQRPTVSVVIPTLNEAENLPLVLPYLPMDWIDEILLVDGCSTDRTVEVAQQLVPSIKVILESLPEKGLRCALVTRMRQATS